MPERERQLDHLLRDSRVFDDWDRFVAQVGAERAAEARANWIARREELLSV